MPLTEEQWEALREAVYEITQRNTDHRYPFAGCAVERDFDSDIRILLHGDEVDLEPEPEDRVDEPRPSSSSPPDRRERQRLAEGGD